MHDPAMFMAGFFIAIELFLRRIYQALQHDSCT